MKYILASGSPRRKELLKLIIGEYSVVCADIDEVCPKEILPLKRPRFLASKKARFVAKENPDCIVIGADTAVFLGDTMLGKPKTKEEAKKMLMSLSGKKHKVITGCSIVCGDKELSFDTETYVEFYTLSDSEIEKYIETGEPMDKAGAYGIQGLGSLLVKGIDGDYFNVVGLPVSRLKRELEKFEKFTSIA